MRHRKLDAPYQLLGSYVMRLRLGRAGFSVLLTWKSCFLSKIVKLGKTVGCAITSYCVIDPVFQCGCGSQVALWLEASVFRMRFDAPHYAFRRFLSSLSSHCRIHGHKHAGVRIVQEGSTTALALDAHRAHRGLFTVDDLLPYRSARMPECQRQVMNRRKIMRKARSKTKRPQLLVELERRYRACSSRV